MAESIVQVTEGTGKKLHTWNRTIGANSVEDEVVLLGENYLASYTVQGVPSTATAASHLMQIMAGASLNVRIRRIEYYQNAAATTGQFGSVAIFRLTTAGTGGAAVTPSRLDPADAASGATAMTLPTVKGTEGVVIASGTMIYIQTLTAGMLYGGPQLVWDFDRPRSKPLIIAAGTANGIAVKQEIAIAGATARIVVFFDEANF